MLSHTTMAVFGVLAAVQGVAAQDAGKMTSVSEREQWCGNGGDTLPCDVVAKLDADAIHGAGIKVTDEADRKNRDKLIAYYESRKAIKDQFQKFDECCRKCKVANKLLSEEQAAYWKKVSDEYNEWSEKMEKLKQNPKAENPDTLYEYQKKKGLYNGQPGAPLLELAATRVEVGAECKGPAAAIPKPSSTASKDAGTVIVPQIPVCYYARVNIDARAELSVNSAKFLNVTLNAEAKVAQQYCAPSYYVLVQASGKVETSRVIGQAVAIAGTEVNLKPEQHVYTDCGCQANARPVELVEFSQKSYGSEALQVVSKGGFESQPQAGGNTHFVVLAQAVVSYTNQAPSAQTSNPKVAAEPVKGDASPAGGALTYCE